MAAHKISRERGKTIALYLSAILLSLFSFIPIYWILISALKQTTELYSYPPTLIPRTLSIQNFINIWSGELPGGRRLGMGSFSNYIRNSLIVATSASLLNIFISSLSGYSFARFKSKWNRLFFILILILQLVPGILIIIPLYMMWGRMGLVDNLGALIYTDLLFLLPIGTLFLKSYFEEIPEVIEEAALIDGCSRLGTIFRISLPIAAPGLVATFIFSFIHAWNEYIFAKILLFDVNLYTSTIGLAGYIEEFVIEWGAIMAGSILLSIPPLLFFLFLHRYLLKGLVTGAVK